MGVASEELGLVVRAKVCPGSVIPGAGTVGQELARLALA